MVRVSIESPGTLGGSAPCSVAPIAFAMASTVHSGALMTPLRAVRSCDLLPERGFNFLVVAEVQGLRADDLPGLVTLAGDQQHIARLKRGHRAADRLTPIADLANVRRAGGAVHDGGADRGGIFAARIVVGNDDAIGALGGNGAHQRTLALVAIAAGAEYDNELTFDIGPQRLDGLLQSVGLVSVVDKHRRAVAITHKIEPPLGALQRSQRRENAIPRTTRRNGQ